MAASNEWTEWHLTPKGWVSGSTRVDSVGVTSAAPPDDRVLTVSYREHLSSSYSRLERLSTEKWRASDDALVQRLLARWGPPPDSL